MERKSAKATSVVKRASTILKGIKKEYQKDLQSNIRKGIAITTSAKKAGKSYRDKYGATPTTRWHNALKQASSGAKATNIKPIISYNQNGGVLLMPIMIGLDNNVGLSYKDLEDEKNIGKTEYGFGKFDVYFRYNI